MTNIPVAVTRIINSCVLIEIGGYAVLGDPWFHDRWYLRFGEMPGMRISELPKLGVVLFQRTVVLLSFYVLSLLIVKVSHRGDRRRGAV
jgi:L-ascorbate metabolism protein UlaG (beta-lactamase superfamily)